MSPPPWSELAAEPAALVAAGAALLVLGRRLFWLFVGLAGAGFGLYVAWRVLGLEPRGAALVVAGLIGVAGALLAVVLQKVAVGLAGFLTAAVAAAWILETWRPNLATGWVLVLVLAAGLVGAFLAAWLFEIALVLLTSAAGALLIATATLPPGAVAIAVAGGLALIGVTVQAWGGSGRRRGAR